MQIGNIVSQHNLNDYSRFNVVEDMSEIDNDLPTLLVGYKKTKKQCGELDVLTRKIDNNTSWTFDIRENRELHTDDLEKFKALCYGNITDKVTYVYVDPFNRTTKEIKKIITKIKTSTNIVTYKHDYMVYLLSGKILLGINLDVLDFLEINIEKLVNRIKGESLVFLDDKEILIEYVKDMEYLDNEVMYIPLLYSIKNEL